MKNILYVVLLQATSPLRRVDDISNAFHKIVDENADSLFSSRKVEGFIWRRMESDLQPVDYDYMNRPMRQERNVSYQEENGSIYIFKPNILRQYNSRLGGKITDYSMDMLSSYQIDLPEDINHIKKILQNYKEFKIGE